MDHGHLIGQKLLIAFDGKERPSSELINAIKEYHPSGISLFRGLNVGTLGQLRELNESLQQLARENDLPPLIIGTDQEGGQLMAIGDCTPLPGNMALGATRSADLARQAGAVLGKELAALGVNVNYAPCVDVNINPQNPVVGVRSFGEDPNLVARLGAAMIEGMQSHGVAAAAKHFPGHGDTAGDSHLGLQTVPHQTSRLEAVELPPFSSAIKAGTKLVMTAHIGVTSIDGPNPPPATLSKNILTDLLRHKLGFDGVIITDALDMHAIRQGEFLGEEAVRAFNAGADLLLLTSDPHDQKRVYQALVRAAQNKTINMHEVQGSVNRILRLKEWLSSHKVQPDLTVIGCAEHLKLADEIAERSITLVRDQANILPLRLTPEMRIAVIVPKPQDLTPADTSSYTIPALADSIRFYHPNVDELIVPFAPNETDIYSLVEQIRKHDLTIVGTINACAEPAQQALVHEIMKLNIPVIVTALRLPYDLASFPEVKTFLCTFSILQPSMKALAKALFGFSQISGQLPVSIPGAD